MKLTKRGEWMVDHPKMFHLMMKENGVLRWWAKYVFKIIGI